MSNIKESFEPYWDYNGLIAPSMHQANSGNGVMYTSEYFIILFMNGQLLQSDIVNYSSKMQSCISNGLLNRVPTVIGKSSQEGPDDYLALLNSCKMLKVPKIARSIFWSLFKYKGALNNVNPGTWSWDSFLIRQPQLLCAIVNAAFPQLLNPIHLLIRLLFFPFYLYSAGVIAISGMFDTTVDTDTRRLSWHLIKNVSSSSLVCYLASLIWYRRLYKQYTTQGMRAVATLYYHPADNPWADYWIN